MSIKYLFLYRKYCENNRIIGTITGLKEFYRGKKELSPKSPKIKISKDIIA